MTAVTTYDIEVRPGPNSEFFQYYTETVTANTANDAEQRVQRMNPGCQVRCTRSYTDSEYNGGNSSYSGSSVSIPSFGTLVKSIVVGSVVMWGLQFVPTNDSPQPQTEKITLEQQVQQRHDNIIRHSVHHVNDTIPEFFNTEYQEDVVDDLGQDWDN